MQTLFRFLSIITFFLEMRAQDVESLYPFTLGLNYSENHYKTKYSYEQEEIEWGLFNFNQKDIGQDIGLRYFHNFSMGIKIRLNLDGHNSLSLKAMYSREDVYIAEDSYRYHIRWYYTDLIEMPLYYEYKFREGKVFRPYFSFGLNFSLIFYENIHATKLEPGKVTVLERRKLDLYRTNISFLSGFEINFCKKISMDFFADWRSVKIIQTYSTLDRVRTSKFCTGVGINYSFGRKTKSGAINH